MSVARFIADQRTNYAVPHTAVCALLGVSEAWFYKWIKRADGPGAASGLFTDTATTIEDLDAHVAALEQAAIQANCETRLLAGQQAKAFTAAALPLCRQV